ncbi:ABC transporter permease subunit [Streptomyces sp. NPDC059534]|uniref:ABC transporter permease subunit n=1 Tax=Streptomyces sp. NPDC059534 TaxID=3346859 RepID=UPI0036A8F640
MKHAVAAEWVKLTTLRSPKWSPAVYVVLMIGLAFVYGMVPGEKQLTAPGFDPVGLGLSAVPLGMIVLVIMGILAVTGEYASGSIRSSLLAVPDRARFYYAKVGLVSLVSGVLAVVGVVPAFLIVQGGIGEHRAPAGLATAGHVAGAVLYTVLLVAFSMGVATLLRSGAAALAILLPLFFMLSTILSNIPGVGEVARFLPDVAGGMVLRGSGGDEVLGAWSGLGVLAVWAVGSVGLGHWVTVRRDV